MTATMLLVDGADVDRLADARLGLDAARTTAEIVASRDLVTGRVQVNEELTWMRILAGVLPSLDLVGYKEFHRVGQRVRYHVSLFQRSTADCLGIVDGRRITSLRTASTAALAFAHFFGDEPVELGIVGSGEEAKEGLRALATAVNVTRVKVFSPTEANRAAFAEELGAELGRDIEPVASVDDAVKGANGAYIATSAAGAPFLRLDQVRSVRFVAGIGSTRPNQRELMGEVIANAAQVVIDCEDCRHEPGDVIEAVEQHGFDPDGAVLLGDYLKSPAPKLGVPVVFKSVGSVEQDLVLALRLLEAARAKGLGRDVEPVGSLRIMR